MEKPLIEHLVYAIEHNIQTHSGEFAILFSITSLQNSVEFGMAKRCLANDLPEMPEHLFARPEL